MKLKVNQATEKVTSFFMESLKYYGKEITLQSNQHFSIDKVVNKQKEKQGEYNYHIQYGFPCSGCVSMNFSYSKENGSFSIDKITVYAPPADKEMIITNFASQEQSDEFNISAHLGIDMETEEHKNINSITNNPNALKMLEIAVNDLDKATILGECRIVAPMGSDLIPCTNSTNRPLNKEKLYKHNSNLSFND